MAQPALPVIQRSQGCWNCTGFSTDAAKQFWQGKRQKDLDIALSQSLIDPQGENAQQVVNIRRMVDATDTAVAAGLLGKCLRGGTEADLVSLSFLCEKWTGRQGASIAREGGALDKLPGELMEDVAAGKLPTKRTIR